MVSFKTNKMEKMDLKDEINKPNITSNKELASIVQNLETEMENLTKWKESILMRKKIDIVLRQIVKLYSDKLTKVFDERSNLLTIEFDTDDIKTKQFNISYNKEIKKLFDKRKENMKIELDDVNIQKKENNNEPSSYDYSDTMHSLLKELDVFTLAPFFDEGELKFQDPELYMILEKISKEKKISNPQDYFSKLYP